MKGNKNASVYLVEFSDYQCPACKAFEETVEKIITSSNNKLLFVYRHFPLDQHPMALRSAITSEAAGRQGKFWEMHNLLFKNQDKLSEKEFRDLANELKLDMTKFEADLKDQKLTEKVNFDRADGLKLGINATPTFYLNGMRLTLNTPEDLSKEIEKVLK